MHRREIETLTDRSTLTIRLASDNFDSYTSLAFEPTLPANRKSACLNAELRNRFWNRIGIALKRLPHWTALNLPRIISSRAWTFFVRASRSTWPALYCSITSLTSYGLSASLNFLLATKYLIFYRGGSKMISNFTGWQSDENGGMCGWLANSNCQWSSTIIDKIEIKNLMKSNEIE